jgi:hypothetical protein
MLIFLNLPGIGFLNLIWMRVFAFFKGQDPPRGPLKHLQLIPDSAERHFSPPQLNCSPPGIVFEVFPDMFFSTLLA